MKTYLLFLFAALSNCLIARSQDIIARKNGDTLNAKVLKVNPAEIEYRRTNKPGAALHTMPVTDIAFIIYENGG